MLMQVLHSVRSDFQLVEQIQYSLLFRYFFALSIDDAVWNHSELRKSRGRPIEHDTVTQMLN
jgi:transposase